MITKLAQNNIIVGHTMSGKSILSINIALFLLSINKKVLYIDSDGGIESSILRINRDMSNLHILRTNDLYHMGEIVNKSKTVFDWIIIDRWAVTKNREYIWDVIDKSKLILTAGSRNELSNDFASFRTFNIHKTINKFQVYNNEILVFEFDREDVKDDTIIDIFTRQYIAGKIQGILLPS